MKILLFLLLLPSLSFAGEAEDRKFIEDLALKIMLIKMEHSRESTTLDGGFVVDLSPASELIAMQSFDDAKAFARQRKIFRELPLELKEKLFDVDVEKNAIRQH